MNHFTWCCGMILMAAVVGQTPGQQPGRTPIDEFIREKLKDRALTRDGAIVCAKEVANRLWWPGMPLRVHSARDDKGQWTVFLGLDRDAPATPGCEIVLSREGLIAARFVPGE